MVKQLKKTPCEPPVTLTMGLHTPGMSIMHRAGLGGLACTLKRIEVQYKSGQILDDQVPGAPWDRSMPPWRVSATEIKLDFREPTAAGEFLRRLFHYAFDLENGLVFLPGQYGDLRPHSEVLAVLQAGLMLTFLQHGRTRHLAKESTACTYEVDEKAVSFEYRACTDYKHREGWKDLIDKRDQLKAKPIEIVGPLNPGAMVRHNAFAAQTRIEESVSHVLSLYFAIVGCVALPINRGSGVLLVPDVSDLSQFVSHRFLITPQTVAECQITGASDAALQAQIRLRAKHEIHTADIPGCFAVTFQPTPWAPQQKSRVQTVHIPPGNEIDLDLFGRLMQIPELSPRVVTRSATGPPGRRAKQQGKSSEEAFWADSIVRPLIAENIAMGRPWYEGFSRFMVELDPVSRKPKREKLLFERKGLYAMTESVVWNSVGESTVLKAVQEALGRRYGQIASENKGNSVAMKKRWKGEYDRWRMAFAGAKTNDQFRRAFCDLLSRAPGRGVIREYWSELLPMLDASHWQLARDLSLLGLASYAGKGADVVEQVANDQDNQTAIA